MPNHTTPTDLQPAAWWRRLCFPIPNLAISGDLDRRTRGAERTQLAEWAAAGITDIVDARGEWSDEQLVARLAPEMHYHWVGTHDEGHAQSDEWFDAGVAAALRALAEPDGTVIIHCHMGVNRGPSLAYATLLALGYDVVEALELIRAARPIAAVLYSADAVRWWHSRLGPTQSPAALLADLERVAAWHRDNPVDVAWIISRIRRSDAAA